MMRMRKMMTQRGKGVRRIDIRAGIHLNLVVVHSHRHSTI